MQLLDVNTYWQLCRFFQDAAPQPDLANVSDSLDYITLAYGVGVYDLMSGNEAHAVALWQNLTHNATYWPSFGFVAAEADMYRLEHRQNDIKNPNSLESSNLRRIH